MEDKDILEQEYNSVLKKLEQLDKDILSGINIKPMPDEIRERAQDVIAKANLAKKKVHKQD